MLATLPDLLGEAVEPRRLAGISTTQCTPLL